MPTAQTSSEEAAATPSRCPKSPFCAATSGVGVRVQLEPSQCRATVLDWPTGATFSVWPVAHTSVGDTASTAERLGYASAVRGSGWGLGASTTLQFEPSQCSTRFPPACPPAVFPTAHASSGARTDTDSTCQYVVPGSARGTALQA